VSGKIDLPKIPGNNGSLRKLNAESDINQNQSISQTRPAGVKQKDNDTIELQPGLNSGTPDFDPIKDMDMAKEQIESSKLSILQQTPAALQAQANVVPQFLFSLLS